MKKYDFLVIGWGKAGKTIAKQLASYDYKIAMVEQTPKMYGGTCINVACIPSKTLLHAGLESESFDLSMNRKEDVVTALNAKNFNNLDSENNVDIYTLKAQFVNDHEVDLIDDNQEVAETIHADKIIINTGSQTNIPNIKGIDTAQNIFDSEGIMELPSQPDHLVIIGAGYVALEFATIFRSMGTEVTVIHRNKHILAKEDRDIAGQVYQNLIVQGVKFVDEADTTEFSMKDLETVIHTTQGDYTADAVLLATGRKPNIDLSLENTGINLEEDGSISVNDHLQTTLSHIYAVGDVKGGAQHTYISLDDARIVMSDILEDGTRTTGSRGAVPYTLFVDPPLGRVGLTAGAAKKQGYNIKEGEVEVKNIPRHKINNDDRGLLKVVVNADDDQILGASLYCKTSEELINLVKIAIDNHLPYQVLRDNIYTHPTMVESFNNLFKVQ